MSKKTLSHEDIMSLEPVDKLDEEELAFHQQLQKGNFVLRNDEKIKNKYTDIFRASNRKRKALSLRMPENDYIEIKAKALALGMPYQALINSVLHRFLTGDLA